VRHIEHGLAARAGELDLGGVHALRPGSRAARGSGEVRRRLRLRRRRRQGRRGKQRRRMRDRRRGRRRRSRGGLGRGGRHELRREALRHAALGADELRHAGGHGEDAAAPRAADLDGGRRGRGGAAAGHRGGGEGSGLWGSWKQQQRGFHFPPGYCGKYQHFIGFYVRRSETVVKILFLAGINFYFGR
jgi:hypothetical protein